MKIFDIRYTFLIVIGCTLFILLCSFLGERGYIKVRALKNELRGMEEYNQNVKAENDVLQDTIYLLKNDKRYIEKIAREELGLVRAEEMIYLFESN